MFLSYGSHFRTFCPVPVSAASEKTYELVIRSDLPQCLEHVLEGVWRMGDVDGGRIEIDNQDVRNVTRRSLRSQYGMVLQETWLKKGTVKENIRMGKPTATDEEIIQAAKKTHAHSFIKRMEKGYDTLLSEDGGNLSEGQKQLLCITRVMLALPPMLILDEATSSIDTRTERKISQAFDALTEGKTAFIVAHRLSTIVRSHLILVMDNNYKKNKKYVLLMV